VEKEKYLAASHESAHVVINATKGRRVDEVHIWLRDDRSYHGVTLVRIFTADGTEPGHIRGAIGDVKGSFDKVKVRADAIIAAQQAKIELPIILQHHLKRDKEVKRLGRGIAVHVSR